MDDDGVLVPLAKGRNYESLHNEKAASDCIIIIIIIIIVIVSIIQILGPCHRPMTLPACLRNSPPVPWRPRVLCEWFLEQGVSHLA